MLFKFIFQVFYQFQFFERMIYHYNVFICPSLVVRTSS